MYHVIRADLHVTLSPPLELGTVTCLPGHVMCYTFTRCHGNVTRDLNLSISAARRVGGTEGEEQRT